jgi:hypothetical protein
MTKLSLKETATPHALLYNSGGSGVEVAAFLTKAGDRMISNADINPFSPLDGTPMQLASAKKIVLPAKDVRSMISVGHCQSCNRDLLATASFADAIDTAGEAICCTFCSASVTPSIDHAKLIVGLAAEYEDEPSEEGEGEQEENYPSSDGGEDYNQDEGDEGGEGEGGEGEGDTNMYDDGEPSPYEDTEDTDGDGGKNEDDEDAKGDEMAGVVSSLRKRRLRASANDANGGATSNADADETMENTASEDAEFNMAVAQLRKQVVALGLDTASDEDCEEDEDYPESTDDENSNSEYSDEDEDSPDENMSDEDRRKMEEGAKFVKGLMAKSHVFGDRPIAGKGVDRQEIVAMNDAARAALRTRRGDRADGNSYLKGANAIAAADNHEGDIVVGEDSITPGTNPTEGETNHQVETPGSSHIPPENPDTQERTPGTNEMSTIDGDKIVDWASEKIELIATANEDTRWIFANGRPVGNLNRAKASAGLSAKWEDVKTIALAFKSACARGLPSKEAKEFGFTPSIFKVEGSDVIRNAMQRQASLATENAQNDVSRKVDRYKQSVRTALAAVLKGVYPDTKNPMRDALVVSLAKLSVIEPRSVVDTAMAASLEPFLVSIFTKADEIANKSDEARNEIAQFVATSSYQARVDEGSRLAATLASGNDKVVFGGARPTITRSETAETVSHSDLVRQGIRSLTRR